MTQTKNTLNELILKINENNIFIKLSNPSTINSLDYAYELLEDNNIGKFTTIDIRVDNQIILNE